MNKNVKKLNMKDSHSNNMFELLKLNIENFNLKWYLFSKLKKVGIYWLIQSDSTHILVNLIACLIIGDTFNNEFFTYEFFAVLKSPWLNAFSLGYQKDY